MEIHDIERHLARHPGLLTLRPGSGDGTPQLSWGDLFFYVAPDGEVPASQPFATVVTKNYPDEPEWHRAGSTSFRVNIAVGARESTALTGRTTAALDPLDVDHRAPDEVLPHPVYGRLGWICVVDPGPRTEALVRHHLDVAFEAAQRRLVRRPPPRAPTRSARKWWCLMGRSAM